MGEWAQHNQCFFPSSSSSSPSLFFPLPLSLPFSLKSPAYLLFIRHCPWCYEELDLDSHDTASLGPGPCSDINKVHLLLFPDTLFPNLLITQFPSLPPGCPEFLIILPNPGISLQEVPLVSELPLAHVCLLLYCNCCFLRTSQMDAQGLNQFLLLLPSVVG
uniref:Uncharacterized protein n=1 Tax=Rousettus aegyptiacus TaxID=9407 RepID=A0A7J8H0Z4_ROUAE|nr:hypothetical protein HJG63_011332 [Rousettus aegyptiacus]